MSDEGPYLRLISNSAIVYGNARIPCKHTTRPIESDLLREKLAAEIRAVQDHLVPGMNAEESVEHVLGFKRGLSNKITHPCPQDLPWKIEVGVLLFYMDCTGQAPMDLPIEPQSMQRLKVICDSLRYRPNQQRRRRFEEFRLLHRQYAPDILAARHRCDIELAALPDWTLVAMQVRVVFVADAFELNDLCRDERKAGRFAESDKAHVALHTVLTAPAWRELMRYPLQRTISTIETDKAELDPITRADEEHKNHEELISHYAKWIDMSHVPAARTYISERHDQRSDLLRMELKSDKGKRHA